MIQITLKAKYHAYIISLMPDKGDVSKINYILQIRKAITGDYDPEQDITVTVDAELVKSMYLIIGSQQERLAAADNREIKNALVPQLVDHPELLQTIVDITNDNAAQTEQLRQTGVDFIMSIMA